MTYTRTWLTALTLITGLTATSASASSLLPPLVVAPGADLTFTEIDPRAEIAIFGTVDRFDDVSGFTSASFTMIFDYLLATPPSNAAGVFAIDDGSAFLLTGSIDAASLIGDTILLSLSGLDGSEKSVFSTPVFAEIVFDTLPGADLFGALTNANPYGVTVTIGAAGQSPVTAPIPLPAGLPLLASGIALFCWVSRRARRTA